MPALAALDYTPPGYLGPGWGLLLALSTLLIGAGAAIVLMLVRARTLAGMQARENALVLDDARIRLSRGPGRAVSGRVELDGGEETGVRVDIGQVVKNHRSRNLSWHTWDEVSRQVYAAPFYLVSENGPSVYVEPDASALVVDGLETSYPRDRRNFRVRFADVRAGELFHAYGDVFEATHPRAREDYRGSIGWVLRPPRRGRMILATTAIADRYRPRIRFLWRWGWLSAAAYCLFHAFVTAPFLTATLLGEHTTTNIVGTSTYVTRDKHRSTTHYVLHTRTSDGFALAQELPRQVYLTIAASDRTGGLRAVPLLRTRDWAWASYLGDHASVSILWIMLGTMATMIATVALTTGYRTRYAWYDRTKLSEHGGAGLWTDPRPMTDVPPGVD
jgi:hypothetical protein